MNSAAIMHLKCVLVFVFLFQPVLMKSIHTSSEVDQMTKHYPCCSGSYDIPLNVSCDNHISIGNKSLARVKGSEGKALKPFTWDGRQMKVEECKDFLLQTICDDDDGYKVEKKINFKSHPCPEPKRVPDAAAALCQEWPLVILTALKIMNVH